MPSDTVADRSEPRSSQSLIGKTRANDVWHRMREDILCGVLVPGSRLPFEQLKSTYGVSFATLREALSRLAAERLVLADAQRGFTVAPILVEELLDITRVRVMLETEALRQSIAKGDEAWRMSVIRSFHELDRLTLTKPNAPEWFEAHSNFHASLIAACGSALLVRLCGGLFDSSHRYRRISMSRQTSSGSKSGQHRELMEAAMTGRADAAVEIISEHIWKATNIVVAAIGPATDV